MHDFKAALDDIRGVSGPGAGSYIMKEHHQTISAALELAIKLPEILEGAPAINWNNYDQSDIECVDDALQKIYELLKQPATKSEDV